MRFFQWAVFLLFLECSASEVCSSCRRSQNLQETGRSEDGPAGEDGIHPEDGKEVMALRMLRMLRMSLWMVSVHTVDFSLSDSFSMTYRCDGAALNKYWIVTASSCIDLKHDPQRYKVLQATQSDQTFPGVLDDGHRVAELRQNSDLGLLRVEKPLDDHLPNGRFIEYPIKLSEEDYEPNCCVNLIGCDGFRNGVALPKRELREISVPIVPRKLCNLSYNAKKRVHDVNGNFLCAALTREDLCDNHYYGPLYQTKDDVTTLLGLYSGGYGCFNNTYSPRIYAKVSRHLTWIKANTGLT